MSRCGRGRTGRTEVGEGEVLGGLEPTDGGEDLLAEHGMKGGGEEAERKGTKGSEGIDEGVEARRVDVGGELEEVAGEEGSGELSKVRMTAEGRKKERRRTIGERTFWERR